MLDHGGVGQDKETSQEWIPASAGMRVEKQEAQTCFDEVVFGFGRGIKQLLGGAGEAKLWTPLGAVLNISL